MYLPSLDRIDLAALLVCLGLLFVAFVVYRVEWFQVVAVLVVFTISLAWMAFLLQKWMFEGSA